MFFLYLSQCFWPKFQVYEIQFFSKYFLSVSKIRNVDNMQADQILTMPLLRERDRNIVSSWFRAHMLIEIRSYTIVLQVLSFHQILNLILHHMCDLNSFFLWGFHLSKSILFSIIYSKQTKHRRTTWGVQKGRRRPQAASPVREPPLKRL